MVLQLFSLANKYLATYFYDCQFVCQIYSLLVSSEVKKYMVFDTKQ